MSTFLPGSCLRFLSQSFLEALEGSERVKPQKIFSKEEKKMFTDFVVTFFNGVSVLNCTPHPANFLDAGELVVVPPCGATLKAAAGEEVVGSRGMATLVTTVFSPSPEGLQELKAIEAEVPEGTLIVGSIISAQAYPNRVVSMTPLPGFERMPPADKRMSTEKFNIFQ